MSASRPSPTRACPESSPSGMRLRLEDDQRNLAVRALLVLRVPSYVATTRGQSSAFSSGEAIRACMGRVWPFIVIWTFGSSRRLRNQVGCRSSPP